MIRCEVTAHRLDLAGSWRLYVCDARSPREALRWLRRQAAQVADRLDPDPHASWAPTGALRVVDESVPDAPAELRSWGENLSARLEALHLLKEGHQVIVTVHDETAYYTLTAVPDPYASVDLISVRREAQR